MWKFDVFFLRGEMRTSSYRKTFPLKSNWFNSSTLTLKVEGNMESKEEEGIGGHVFSSVKRIASICFLLPPPAPLQEASGPRLLLGDPHSLLFSPFLHHTPCFFFSSSSSSTTSFSLQCKKMMGGQKFCSSLSETPRTEVYSLKTLTQYF